MEASPEHSEAEITRLQRCIGDLVSVLALPAIWTGSEPAHVASTLLDTLLRMLHLDLAYIRLNQPSAASPIAAPFELARISPTRTPTLQPRQVAALVNRWLGSDPAQWPPLLSHRIEEESISILALRMGLQGEIGVLVAGSQRADFPTQAESLILSVATNQALNGLHEARLLSEQKRVTRELDHRVAERTQELAATNQALAAANQELQLQVGLLQHIPVIAWTLHPDGTPDFVNQNWVEYTGQTLAVVRSAPLAWLAVVHPDDRESASASYMQGVRSGRDFVMEARFFRARDAAFRWHLNRAVALRDAAGNILRFVGTSTEIEEVKRSQEDRRRAEERTRLIIDTAMDAVITMDTQGTITSWNKQAESIFGWSETEAVGRRMSHLIIPERLRADHERGLRHFLATGDGPILRRRVEVTAARRGGDEFPAELQVMPLRLGQEWVFSAFVRDITESKRAEDELRRSEAFLAHGQRLSSTGSFSFRVDTNEITFSEHLYRIFELDPDVPVTLDRIVTRIHPDDIPIMSRKVNEARTISNEQDYEIRLRMPDGSIKYLHNVAHPATGPHGQVEYIGVIQDVTERRLSEEALAELRSELAHMTRVTSLGALTASIAHEVNQPLSGIVTNASTCMRMLAAEPPNVSGALETARRTIRDGQRASDVIVRLRALFSKKDASMEPVDLNDAAQEVIALSSSELQRNRVILRRELAASLPAILGDRVQLQQVILNLLRNASDAMSAVDDRPRHLLIRTETEADDRVRLTVQDAGVGIDPLSLQRLFDPFYTTKPNGMGMGLSVSRSIIESHRGQLSAKLNEGPGASFSFTLPQANEENTRTIHHPNPTRHPGRVPHP